MQSGYSATSTTNIGTSMDVNMVNLQPVNNNAQQNTRYVTSNMATNQPQLVNLPRAPGQYITIQPGGFQILPIQGSNPAQYIQLQLQNVQQSGGNFVQIQTAPTQNLQKNLTQAFVPLQPQLISQTNQQDGSNQNVSIQLVQNPGISESSTQYLHQQPVLSLQSALSPTVVGPVTVGQSTPVAQIGNLNRNEITQASNTVAGSQNVTAVSTSSSLFLTLKQAATATSSGHSTNNNTPMYSLSNISLPTQSFNQMAGPSTITNPAIVASQTKTNEHKSFQGAIVVMSGGNKQSIIIPRTQAGSLQQMNPMFLPITMANSMSVLTNQGKRAGQLPQSSVLKIQQQIAPRVLQTQASSAPTTIATSATAAVVNQNNQQKYFIQPASSLIQQQGTQIRLQQQSQQQTQQFIFQTVQGNIAQLNQRKKEASVSGAASISKQPNRVPVSSASSAADSKPLKKPCNCTKSQCLKLYCECFANGEFCNNCNCRMCLNNINHEAERSKAIKACLERNAYAFHPKIGKGRVKGDNERRHTKGCNCKRSGCLKNYCECYEAKILCSSLCRCSGCKNFEESDDRKTLMHLADAAEVCVQQQNAAKSKLATQMDIVRKKVPNGVKEKLPVSFLTADVSKATCEILMAKAAEGEADGHSSVELEKSIILEFSRCLDQIIDKSRKAKNGNR